MALTLADVVLRRLDLGTAGPPAEDDLAEVAAVWPRRWPGTKAARARAPRSRAYAAPC